MEHMNIILLPDKEDFYRLPQAKNECEKTYGSCLKILLSSYKLDTLLNSLEFSAFYQVPIEYFILF